MLKSKPALVIFTKLPGKEKIKTRLTPTLSSEEAAMLQRCMFLDTLALAKSVEEYFTVIAYAPGGEKGVPEDMQGQALHIPQTGDSLGARMSNALREVFTRGYSPAVLTGTDIPTLPRYILKDALKELRKKDVVLGPSLDGGYYLIGMHRLYPGIFRRISWGTSEVLSQTITRIREEGLSFSCLESWYDVDTREDLVFVGKHIEALRKAGVRWPRNTRGFLKGLGL